MPRGPRVEFPGAMYHVSARGNRREPIVLGDDERKALIVHLLMEQTSMAQKWIVEKSAMGPDPCVNRSTREMGQRIAAGDREMTGQRKAIVARSIT